VSLPDGDGRKPVQKPIHHLHRSLRSRIADTARDDDGSVSIAATQTSTSQVLGQAADQSNRRRGPKRGQVVMVHLVAEAGVADLIESEELVEAVRAAVRHQQAVERHSEPRFAKGLDRLRFSENSCAGGDKHLPARMRVERIGHETVHRRGARAIQSICQNGVDNGSFQHWMQRSRRANRWRLVGNSARLR